VELEESLSAFHREIEAIEAQNNGIDVSDTKQAVASLISILKSQRQADAALDEARSELTDLRSDLQAGKPTDQWHAGKMVRQATETVLAWEDERTRLPQLLGEFVTRGAAPLAETCGAKAKQMQALAEGLPEDLLSRLGPRLATPNHPPYELLQQEFYYELLTCDVPPAEMRSVLRAVEAHAWKRVIDATVATAASEAAVVVNDVKDLAKDVLDLLKHPEKAREQQRRRQESLSREAANAAAALRGPQQRPGGNAALLQKVARRTRLFLQKKDPVSSKSSSPVQGDGSPRASFARSSTARSAISRKKSQHAMRESGTFGDFGRFEDETEVEEGRRSSRQNLLETQQPLAAGATDPRLHGTFATWTELDDRATVQARRRYSIGSADDDAGQLACHLMQATQQGSSGSSPARAQGRRKSTQQDEEAEIHGVGSGWEVFREQDARYAVGRRRRFGTENEDMLEEIPSPALSRNSTNQVLRSPLHPKRRWEGVSTEHRIDGQSDDAHGALVEMPEKEIAHQRPSTAAAVAYVGRRTSRARVAASATGAGRSNSAMANSGAGRSRSRPGSGLSWSSGGGPWCWMKIMPDSQGVRTLAALIDDSSTESPRDERPSCCTGSFCRSALQEGTLLELATSSSLSSSGSARRALPDFQDDSQRRGSSSPSGGRSSTNPSLRDLLQLADHTDTATGHVPDHHRAHLAPERQAPASQAMSATLGGGCWDHMDVSGDMLQVRWQREHEFRRRACNHMVALMKASRGAAKQLESCTRPPTAPAAVLVTDSLIRATLKPPQAAKAKSFPRSCGWRVVR